MNRNVANSRVITISIVKVAFTLFFRLTIPQTLTIENSNNFSPFHRSRIVTFDRIKVFSLQPTYGNVATFIYIFFNLLSFHGWCKGFENYKEEGAYDWSDTLRIRPVDALTPTGGYSRLLVSSSTKLQQARKIVELNKHTPEAFYSLSRSSCTFEWYMCVLRLDSRLNISLHFSLWIPDNVCTKDERVELHNQPIVITIGWRKAFGVPLENSEKIKMKNLNFDCRDLGR